MKSRIAAKPTPFRPLGGSTEFFEKRRQPISYSQVENGRAQLHAEDAVPSMTPPH